MVLARQKRYADALDHLERARAAAPANFPVQDVLDHVREKVAAGN